MIFSLLTFISIQFENLPKSRYRMMTTFKLDNVSGVRVPNNDKEVVMAAVTNCGTALKWASMALKNDKELVMAAD